MLQRNMSSHGHFFSSYFFTTGTLNPHSEHDFRWFFWVYNGVAAATTARSSEVKVGPAPTSPTATTLYLQPTRSRSRQAPPKPPVAPHDRALATLAVDPPFLRPYRRGFKVLSPTPVDKLCFPLQLKFTSLGQGWPAARSHAWRAWPRPRRWPRRTEAKARGPGAARRPCRP